jgi:hypothetical protein
MKKQTPMSFEEQLEKDCPAIFKFHEAMPGQAMPGQAMPGQATDEEDPEVNDPTFQANLPGMLSRHLDMLKADIGSKNLSLPQQKHILEKLITAIVNKLGLDKNKIIATIKKVI